MLKLEWTVCISTLCAHLRVLTMTAGNFSHPETENDKYGKSSTFSSQGCPLKCAVWVTYTWYSPPPPIQMHWLQGLEFLHWFINYFTIAVLLSDSVMHRHVTERSTHLWGVNAASKHIPDSNLVNTGSSWPTSHVLQPEITKGILKYITRSTLVNMHQQLSEHFQ